MALLHYHVEELDLPRKVKWHLGVFQVHKITCNAFGICFTKTQREQVICQSSKKWVREFEDGPFGTCVILGKGETQPIENWIN
jgi:hypothetical protein